ncbi:chromosome segregation protein Spc25-domain-containing protein [Panaeolus papilionaceus]|nr:chromosome segregation protein Spc25-domain-containing protein [Panaeolus papilionaceus]
MAQTLRIPQIDLEAILQQQNPTIDLRLQPYENSTRNFLKAVTSYKNRAIATISERRKHQTMEKKKILEKRQNVEAETTECRLREIDLVAQLENEKEERKEAELKVAAFTRQKATLEEKCDAVEADIQQYVALTQNWRREKDKERSLLSTHASKAPLELRACENYLGCAIEGVDMSKLMIIFSNLDPSDPHREASFVLDLSTSTYKVLTASPVLPTMAALVSRLNDSMDIYVFIKDVRAAYQQILDKQMTS